MTAEVVVDVDGTRCSVEMVAEHKAGSTTGNPLIILQFGLSYASWVAGIKVGNVDVGIDVKVVVDIIAKFHVSAVLLEAHVATMVVTTSVLSSHRAVELAATYLIRCFGLNGSPTTCANVDFGADTVNIVLTCDEVHNTAHCIRTIKERSRTAYHLDTFDGHRLIAVGYTMAKDTLILRMSVDEYHDLSRSR